MHRCEPRNWRLVVMCAQRSSTRRGPTSNDSSASPARGQDQTMPWDVSYTPLDAAEART